MFVFSSSTLVIDICADSVVPGILTPTFAGSAINVISSLNEFFVEYKYPNEFQATSPGIASSPIIPSK